MEDNKYILNAGNAHGITNGAEFAVYLVNDDSPPMTLVVVNTGEHSAVMDVPPGASRFALVTSAFAFKTKAGTEENIRFHIAMANKLTIVFEALSEEIPHKFRILCVDSQSEADFDIVLESDQVVFHILNPFVTRYGSTRIPYRIAPVHDSVYTVICAMAHYHRYLRRTNSSHPQHDVRIEFLKLKSYYDNNFEDQFKPDGPNLNVGGVVNLVVGPDDMYGIKIVNESDLTLYPSVFFFDSDLSIGESILSNKDS